MDWTTRRADVLDLLDWITLRESGNPASTFAPTANRSRKWWKLWRGRLDLQRWFLARTDWQKIGVKRITSQTTPTPDKAGSRATSIAQTHYNRIAGIGAETNDDDRRDGRICLVPTVDFAYPDEDDEPAPRVRDDWRPGPLLEKCSKQRFASVPSGDVMTMPLLDKRLEVLRYALREAVEQMDLSTIHRLAEKAIATAERIATEQLAAATPGTRERHDDLVIVDDAERGKVLIQFANVADARVRRYLRIAGFFSGGDGVTYWRKRSFRHGENYALERARYVVSRVLDDRAKLATHEAAAFAREMKRPIAA